MEKPLYPSVNMRITQGYNIGTHKNSYAIDDAGLNKDISYFRAPFTGIIKKIYSQDANEVWLESTEPVEYPDGTIDHLTIMFAHADTLPDLFVGKKINQGEFFYPEGTKGNATGNHVHLECGQGKFTGSGWYKTETNNYAINNGKKPEECLWLDEKVNIIDNFNYNFKKISTETVENPSLKDSKNIDLIYTCPKTGLYGIYLNEKDKLYLEK